MRSAHVSCMKLLARYTVGQQQAPSMACITTAAFPSCSTDPTTTQASFSNLSGSSSSNGSNSVSASLLSSVSSAPISHGASYVPVQHCIHRQVCSAVPLQHTNLSWGTPSLPIQLTSSTSSISTYFETHAGRSKSHAHAYATHSSPGPSKLFSQQSRPAIPKPLADVAGPLSGKSRSNAQQTAFNAHPPGSDRWNAWIKQLNFSGLTLDQATEALSATPTLLEKAALNRSEEFRNLSAILMSEAKVTPAQLREILMRRPEILMISHLQGVVENLKWFKASLGINTEEWMQMLFDCRVLIKLRSHELQERLDFYLGLGLDPAGVRARWKTNPELLRINVSASQEKLSILKTLFDVSGEEVVRSEPLVLLHASKGLRERAYFLQQLNGSSKKVSLAAVQHASLDVDFAANAVQAHLASTGKSLSQLWGELQQVPGVADYMQKSKHDPNTLTEHRYFLVSVMFCRPNKGGK